MCLYEKNYWHTKYVEGNKVSFEKYLINNYTNNTEIVFDHENFDEDENKILELIDEVIDFTDQCLAKNQSPNHDQNETGSENKHKVTFKDNVIDDFDLIKTRKSSKTT